jgi:mono/diheme cytochrome c family protein
MDSWKPSIHFGKGATARLRMVVLAALLVAAIVLPGEAAAPAQLIQEGQALFQERCIACHTIGQGDRVGPDLAGVASRRDHVWLDRWISAPDRMLAQSDPTAKALLEKYRGVPMPNQGLTPDQVNAVVAYLESAPSGPAGAQATVASLPRGNPAVGKELFTGILRFQNGGGACMACHSIAGIGALGGGALGPDLTPAFDKYTEAGLATFLATMPLPTMNAVWSAHPLTPQEQANVMAFLQQAAVAGRPIEAVGRLAALAAGGTVLLFLIAQLYWRRRLTTVRRGMLERSAPSPTPFEKRG